MQKQVIVIGAVATGAKAACRIKRLEPHTKVTMIDEDEFISYAACGMPFYLSGDVSNLDALRSTTAKVVRDADFFENIKNVNTRTSTKVLKINPHEKTIIAKNLKTKQEEELSYDYLVLATGAHPKKINLDGYDLQGIHYFTNLHFAEAVHKEISGGKIKNAVIIGAGFIGLEVAVSLADMWGIKTTIIEQSEQILLNIASKNIAQMIKHDLADLDIEVFTNEKVLSFKGENHKVSAVVTSSGEIAADLVIIAAGVTPNSSLAKEAGIKCDMNGAILVNEYMQTSNNDIYAGGDCVSTKNIITGTYGYTPLGSLANKHGRIIANNICEKKEKYLGHVGSWAIKLNTMNVMGVGLEVEKAVRLDFNAINVSIESDDRAHFYPGATMTCLELVVERETGRILGAQGISANGDSLKARIDAIAMLIQFGNAFVSNLSQAETVYAPPYAQAMDMLNTLANVAENVLEKKLIMLMPDEFLSLWENRDKNNVYFLDARPEHKPVLAMQEKYPNNWHVIPLEKIKTRKAEIDKNKPVAIICNSGLRAYETVLELKKDGYKVLGSSLGGMQSFKKRGQDWKS